MNKHCCNWYRVILYKYLKLCVNVKWFITATLDYYYIWKLTPTPKTAKVLTEHRLRGPPYQRQQIVLVAFFLAIRIWNRTGGPTGKTISRGPVYRRFTPDTLKNEASPELIRFRLSLYRWHLICSTQYVALFKLLPSCCFLNEQQWHFICFSCNTELELY